jgi:HD-GYP domain-containing protein (c-di-GMP phosphodiesterase class II)/Tfp pilus assembly protein PilZ
MSAPLYNSRIIDTYIKLIKSRYSFVDINVLLHSAGMKPYEVADQSHWFTQEQVDRFYASTVKMTGNEHIAREAGRYAASPDAIGVMRQYVLGFVGPANAFEIISKVTSNFTRSSRFESRKISANSVEIIVTPIEGVTERPFQCENRIGFLEAVVMVYGHKPPRIEHTQCIFHGADSCSYIITWESSRSLLYKKIGIATTVLCGGVSLALALLGHWTLLEHLMHLFLPFILLMAIIVAISENKELKASLEISNETSDKLIEQIDSNYNNALMTNEIGQILSSCTHSEEILALVIKIMQLRLDYDRGLVFLANPDESKLILQAGYGYSPEHRDMLDSVSFHLDRPQSKGVFVVSFREQRPFLVNDLNEIEENLSTRSLAFAKKIGTLSFICCPIISEGRSIGVLAVDNVQTKRTLVESDISRMMGIASVIGISIRNVELIEAKVRQFNSVLQVLAASIDARDSMTSGHSEMVTEYSVGICQQLDLTRDETEMIRVAALLHDYGKIGVPDSILKKEGKLTPEEYTIVKTHAEKTREILFRVNFEGMYCKIPEIAGAHHEKVDGSGYPKGLKGSEIPLGAKIIAVADYFEAITAKRHYRDPMQLEEALQLLRDGRGTLFDEQVLDAFFTYYAKTYPTVPVNPPDPDDPTQRDDNAPEPVIPRSPRIPNQARVSYSVDGKAGFAHSKDISRHGAFIATDEGVPEGAPVDLFITLTDNTPTITARGRVAWLNTRSSLKKPSYPAGFGVEILEFKGMTERFLESFLNSCISTYCSQANQYPAELA